MRGSVVSLCRGWSRRPKTATRSRDIRLVPPPCIPALVTSSAIYRDRIRDGTSEIDAKFNGIIRKQAPRFKKPLLVEEECEEDEEEDEEEDDWMLP
jgi:hypothetical protein